MTLVLLRFFLVQAAVSHLAQSPNASIINTTSINGTSFAFRSRSSDIRQFLQLGRVTATCSTIPPPRALLWHSLALSLKISSSKELESTWSRQDQFGLRWFPRVLIRITFKSSARTRPLSALVNPKKSRLRTCSWRVPSPLTSLAKSSTSTAAILINDMSA